MELYSNEIKYYECSATNIISILNVQQGTIYITSKRIVFCKRPWYALPLLGPLLMHLFKGTVEVFEIPLRKLEKIAIAKHGFAKKYEINFAPNKKESIQLMDFNRFINSIEKAVQESHPEMTMIQNESQFEFTTF
jgi:hypothetical protein